MQAATGHLTVVLGYGWKLIAISSLIIDIALLRSVIKLESLVVWIELDWINFRVSTVAKTYWSKAYSKVTKGAVAIGC